MEVSKFKDGSTYRARKIFCKQCGSRSDSSYWDLIRICTVCHSLIFNWDPYLGQWFWPDSDGRFHFGNTGMKVLNFVSGTLSFTSESWFACRWNCSTKGSKSGNKSLCQWGKIRSPSPRTQVICRGSHLTTSSSETLDAKSRLADTKGMLCRCESTVCNSQTSVSTTFATHCFS